MGNLQIHNTLLKRYGPNQYKQQVDKKSRPERSDIENQVASAILDIQTGADAATKEQLMQLYITGVKEFDVGGRNAIVVSVPAPQVTAWQKIQTKTVREPEKKFSNKHVIICGARKIMPKEAKTAGSKCYKQKRPVCRSVKMVNERCLEDIVYPAEIVGKRIRHKVDSTKLIKTYLDKGSATNIEHKLATFSAVYKRLP